MVLNMVLNVVLIPASFFNEWLEKHRIMRNQFQEPKLHRQHEELVSLIIAIALAVPLEVPKNLIKYSIDDNVYHRRFSNSKCF